MAQPDSDKATPATTIDENPDTAGREQAIDFQGRARQYFGIWIVNVLLTLVTLGIYSAWAKVRRITYFHNKTLIDGHPLLYHATGLRILIGRIIVFTGVIAIQATIEFTPAPIFYGQIALFLIFLVVSPIVINASLRFQARMTSYRNVRFNWRGRYWPTMKYLVLGPVIGLLTLWILYPWMMKRYYRYFANTHYYGTTSFDAEPSTREFYCAFLTGVLLPVFLIAIVIVPALLLAIHFLTTDLLSPTIVDAVWFASTYLSFAFFVALVYPVLCRNMLLRTLKLGGVVEFKSNVRPLRYNWIQITNILALIFSAGLAYPWTKVRSYRYLASRTFLTVTGDVGRFVDDQQEQKSALGEELAGMVDIGVGI